MPLVPPNEAICTAANLLKIERNCVGPQVIQTDTGPVERMPRYIDSSTISLKLEILVPGDASTETGMAVMAKVMQLLSDFKF